MVFVSKHLPINWWWWGGGGGGSGLDLFYQSVSQPWVSCEPLNLLLPNIVWSCIIMHQPVIWKHSVLSLLSSVKVSITTRVQLFKQWLSYCFLNQWTFSSQIWLLQWFCEHELQFHAKHFDCSFEGQSQRTEKLNTVLSHIFWTTETFTAKLGMVLHHYEPDCIVKMFEYCLHSVSCSQVQS